MGDKINPTQHVLKKSHRTNTEADFDRASDFSSSFVGKGKSPFNDEYHKSVAAPITKQIVLSDSYQDQDSERP